MNALTLKLKNDLLFTLDAGLLTPENLEGKTLAQIKELKVGYGNKNVKLETLFTISGTDTNNICIEKSTNKLSNVGKGLNSGSISIKGDVGDFLGKDMKDGALTVEGNAGSWVGNAMSGGRIDITGNVLDYVGGGLPGDAYGMSNGLINIKGNAGDRIGDRMRRGIIIIQGKAGDYCGSRIHAGTIIVLDKVGKLPGEGMRRGSIILAKKPTHLSATFKSCGNLKMQFLRLLFTQLANIDTNLSFFNKHGPEAHRFSGDLARNGKGEILILQHYK